MLTFSWPSKYPFHLLLLQLPARVKVKCALSSAVGIEKNLHRPETRTMSGYSGVLFIALHHQTWGLLLSCHHVPLLYDAQRQFLPSGVTRLCSPLASNQQAVLPGRVRDGEAHFLVQAYSAFPRPHLLSLRVHHNSNALLGQQGPHKAIEWVLRNVNPFPSPWSILYQPRCILPTAKESPTTTHHHHLTVCCSTFMPTE